ncbi:unnamed protein product [Microthlaspi erraticum]|uniref:DYW domain-containing protein n=1 Tax=Microthlaspi erraticum TaxID=1685480 RepID=A0A6D2K6M4_9BRAS|nr:unnamed protein product [Microthlaspi erraticum]
MMRVTCSRILKFSKPYFLWGTQSSSRCFNSRAFSQNVITKNIASSQNRRLVQCSRLSSSQYHAQMAAYDHQSVTIETFDALCEEGNVVEAVEAVKILMDEGYVVDSPRLLGLAKLCGEAEALEEARVVHSCITASDSPPPPSVVNKIIEMYSNCGSTEEALSVFEEMSEKNSETWCVMIRCLAENGYCERAIDMFTRFKEEGNKPDKAIYKEVFSVCASLGNVNEGLRHFEAMHRDYGIVPTMEDYVSVTEMLAASGHLDEALEFVERMTIEPSVEVWETLMNLCWVHGDIERGDRFAELVKKLDATRMNKESSAGLVAKKASDSEKEKLKEMMRTQRKKDRRPDTFINAHVSLHQFSAGDTSHPGSDRIMAVLRSLKVHMLEMGFVHDFRVYLQAMDDEEKEQQLLFRGDKLACAQGILTSSARSPITIIKNLRTCNDGHNALKMI